MRLVFIVECLSVAFSLPLGQVISDWRLLHQEQSRLGFNFHLNQAAKVYQKDTGHACYLKIGGLSFVIGDLIGLGVNKECMVAL